MMASTSASPGYSLARKGKRLAWAPVPEGLMGGFMTLATSASLCLVRMAVRSIEARSLRGTHFVSRFDKKIGRSADAATWTAVRPELATVAGLEF